MVGNRRVIMGKEKDNNGELLLIMGNNWKYWEILGNYQEIIAGSL